MLASITRACGRVRGGQPSTKGRTRRKLIKSEILVRPPPLLLLSGAAPRKEMKIPPHVLVSVPAPPQKEHDPHIIITPTNQESLSDRPHPHPQPPHYPTPLPKSNPIHKVSVICDFHSSHRLGKKGSFDRGDGPHRVGMGLFGPHRNPPRTHHTTAEGTTTTRAPPALRHLPINPLPLCILKPGQHLTPIRVVQIKLICGEARTDLPIVLTKRLRVRTWTNVGHTNPSDTR